MYILLVLCEVGSIDHNHHKIISCSFEAHQADGERQPPIHPGTFAQLLLGHFLWPSLSQKIVLLFLGTRDNVQGVTIFEDDLSDLVMTGHVMSLTTSDQ